MSNTKITLQGGPLDGEEYDDNAPNSIRLVNDDRFEWASLVYRRTDQMINGHTVYAYETPEETT